MRLLKKMIKLKIKCLIILSMALNTYAQTPVLIGSDKLNKSKVVLEDGDKWLDDLPLAPAASLLIKFNETLSQAQKNYIEADFENAKIAYEELVGMRFNSDWSNAQVKSLQLAFLRLSQISNSKHEKEKWLDELIKFSANLHFDKNLFSPDDIKSLSMRKSEISKICRNVDLRVFQNTVGKLYLNSQPLEHWGRQPCLINGHYRISYKSALYGEWSKTLHFDEFTYLPIPVITAVSGSCDNPQILKPMNIPSGDFTVIYDSSCKARYKDGVWITHLTDGQSPLTAINKKPTTKLDQILSVEEPQKKSTHTWMWIGIGAVVAGIVTAIVIANQNKDEGSNPVQPTHE